MNLSHLPDVIVDLIKEFIPPLNLVFVNKTLYTLYHPTIKMDIPLYQNIENKILIRIVNFLELNNYIVGGLQFDGCYIMKKDTYGNLLNDLNEYIKNELGYDITFDFKELDEIYYIPENELEIIKNDIKTKYAGENNYEMGLLFYEQIKDTIIKSGRDIFIKENNCWYNKEYEIERILLKKCYLSNIYKKIEDNKYEHYTSTAKGAKEIIESMLTNVLNSKDFLDLILENSKSKICFKNGVYFMDEKKFRLWNECKDIETVIILSYDFEPIPDEDKIKEIEQKIFKDVFGEDRYIDYLRFLARSISGEYEDKQFAIFTGERDCGKGVNTNQLELCFEEYINVTNGENFLYHKSCGDQAKKYSWMNKSVSSRITITNEIKMNNFDKNLILDGTTIKKFTSGGDRSEIRTNFKDEMNIKMRSRLIMMNNDIPEITPNDALENLIIFRGINKFVSDSKLEELKETVNNEDFLKIYKIADPKIKNKFSSIE